jgi:hypothetical protein
MRTQLRELELEIANSGWEKEEEEPSEKASSEIEGPLGDLVKVFQSVQQLQSNLDKLNLDADQIN